MSMVGTGWTRWIFPPVAAFGVMFSGSAMMLAVFNYFVGPLSQGLALSPAQTSAAMSIYLAILIISTPAAGVLADRLGSRRTLTVWGLVYAAGWVWIARAGPAAEPHLSFASTAFSGGGASTLGSPRPTLA